MKRSWAALLPGLVSTIALLLLWQVVSLFFLATFLPSPMELLSRVCSVFSNPPAYLTFGKTLERILAGLVLSMLLGTASGLVMGLRPVVGSFFDSWIMVLLTFPAISWAFLSVLWFGISDFAPIFTITQIVFPTSR